MIRDPEERREITMPTWQTRGTPEFIGFFALAGGGIAIFAGGSNIAILGCAAFGAIVGFIIHRFLVVRHGH